MGPRAGLDRCGKSHPHQDSIPGPSSPQPVTIPTTLPGPQTKNWRGLKLRDGMTVEILFRAFFWRARIRTIRKKIAYCPSSTSIVIYFGIATCFDGQAVAQLVEALRYKLEGRGFDSQ